ncbi:MAG TPA: anti-sigma factor [Usitatibacter sp.]|jgi:anti-sigma-K factor RskA|nr:anti-sigma factor [Usitatibacter sp.]
MRRPHDELAHALAAEYVLGTLRGAARRRFESLLAGDAGLREIVARWEAWLTPLAGRVPPVEPPARVWRAIEARIAGRAPRRASWWSSVAFWRPWGLVSSGLAAVLLAFFAYFSTGPRTEPVFVAVLVSSSQQPMGVVSMHPPDVLRVRVVHDWSNMKDRSLELWVMPERGAPRSLGLVRNEVGDTMITIEPTDPRVRDAKALAISAEPPGGSPTREPTGPMLCKGMIAPVQRS